MSFSFGLSSPPPRASSYSSCMNNGSSERMHRVCAFSFGKSSMAMASGSFQAPKVRRSSFSVKASQMDSGNAPCGRKKSLRAVIENWGR
jgi:hypothetical protein